MKDLLSFYVNSSIHVALAVVSFAIITTLNFGVTVDWYVYLFIFFSAITGYNFVKYAGIAGLHHLSLTKNLRLIQVFSLFIFAALIYILFHLSLNAILISGVLGILTLLYVIPLFGEGKNLRGFAGIKIYVIAFVWSGVTVLLPLVDEINLFQWNVIASLLQRFLFVFALTLPFEIRDLRFDMANLRTVPQIFGVYRTKIIGGLAILTVLMLEFLKSNSDYNSLFSLIFAGIVLSIFLNKTRIRQTKYFSSFWVEAIPIFWCILRISMELIG